MGRLHDLSPCAKPRFQSFNSPVSTISVFYASFACCRDESTKIDKSCIFLIAKNVQVFYLLTGLWTILVVLCLSSAKEAVTRPRTQQSSQNREQAHDLVKRRHLDPFLLYSKYFCFSVVFLFFVLYSRMILCLDSWKILYQVFLGLLCSVNKKCHIGSNKFSSDSLCVFLLSTLPVRFFPLHLLIICSDL